MLSAQRLSIHMVVWNHQSLLGHLLDSIAAQSWNDWQTVVVDNASRDGVEAWIKAAYPTTVVLRNFRDLGSVRGHNQAIAFALSRWPKESLADSFIAIVTPDLVLAEDTFEHLMRALLTDPELCVVGPKVLRARVVPDETGEGRRIEGTDILESAGVVQTKGLRLIERGRGETDRGQYDDAPDPMSPPGACLVFRASALAEAAIDGEWLDERLPPGQELLDLVWRCRELGGKTRLVPKALAWRQPLGRTSGKNFLSRVRHWYGAETRAERLARWCPLLWQMRHDTPLLALLQLPWRLPRLVGAWGLRLTDPVWGLKSLALWARVPAMLSWRRKWRPRVRVASQTMRKWFT